MTCECSRASGTIRLTLKTVQFRTPFSSAWPLDILHVGKLDDAVHIYLFFHLRTHFPGTRFGVRAELQVPKIRGCTVFVLLQFGLGLAISIPPIPKKINLEKKTGPKMAQMDPDLRFSFLMGLGFWVSNPTAMLLARTTRNCPGRMKTSCEQETSINLRDVCLQQQKRDNPRLPRRWRRWAAFA